jgi:drug/metabolite transporter (DMT)-like permease
MKSSLPLNHTWTVYLKLLLTMILWGIAWPVGRLLAVGLPAISIAVIRYAIVVPVFFLFLQLREHSVKIPRSWIPTFLILGVLNTTLYQAFFLFGVRYAAASDDSLVIGISPVLIAIMASSVLREPLTQNKLLGLLAGLSGVGTISLLSPNVNVLNRPLGISLVFGGALVYAVYTILLRRFINERSEQAGGRRPSSLAIISWVSFLGWLFLIPASILESPWNYTWDQNSWLGILYLALFSTVVGYLFYVDGVTQIGASRAAIFSNLVPVFGVLSSFLLLGEALSVWHGISFALIFAGVVLVNRKPVKAFVAMKENPSDQRLETKPI